MEGHSSLLEKDNGDNKLCNDKQSEEVLIERAVKTTMQIFYDKGIFDNYANAVEVFSRQLSFDEVNEKRKPQLEELNDDVVNQIFLFINTI